MTGPSFKVYVREEGRLHVEIEGTPPPRKPKPRRTRFVVCPFCNTDFPRRNVRPDDEGMCLAACPDCGSVLNLVGLRSYLKE